MKDLNFVLQTEKITYNPERYKAVLMLNGKMSKALPHDSDTDVKEFKNRCKQEADLYGGKLTIQ